MAYIPNIRPISDLRNKFSEIESVVEEGNPVYLTKNGYGTMVVISLEDYSRLVQDVEYKLDEADKMAEASEKRLTHDAVFNDIRKNIKGMMNG